MQKKLNNLVASQGLLFLTHDNKSHAPAAVWQSAHWILSPPDVKHCPLSHCQHQGGQKTDNCFSGRKEIPHTHKHTHTYSHTHTHTYTHIHTYSHTYTHIHTYIHTRTLFIVQAVQCWSMQLWLYKDVKHTYFEKILRSLLLYMVQIHKGVRGNVKGQSQDGWKCIKIIQNRDRQCNKREKLRGWRIGRKKIYLKKTEYRVTEAPVLEEQMKRCCMKGGPMNRRG